MFQWLFSVAARPLIVPTLTVALAASVGANIYQAYGMVSLAKKAAKKSDAVVHLEQKYIGFLNFVRSHNDIRALRKEGRKPWWLPKRFQDQQPEKTEFEGWEDPYSPIPAEN